MGAAYKGIFRRGVVVVNSFAVAVNAGDEASVASLFDANPSIELPAGKKVTVGDLLKGKVLQFEVSALRSAGWYTSCVFDAQVDGVRRHGVAFFQFNPKTNKIVSARFFWNA
jgi:hypothetical protein